MSRLGEAANKLLEHLLEPECTTRLELDNRSRDGNGPRRKVVKQGYRSRNGVLFYNCCGVGGWPVWSE